MNAKTKPSHTAYVVNDAREGSDKEANWREIGAVWPHKDDKGFDVVLDAVPLSGRIVCRERKAKPADEE